MSNYSIKFLEDESREFEENHSQINVTIIPIPNDIYTYHVM